MPTASLVAAQHDRVLKDIKDCRADLRELRRERIAIIAGEMEGDAGIAWTNEERAEARLDELQDGEKELSDRLWDLDADIADAVACRQAELASYAA